MEPMSLGSPVGSPAASSAHYLPPFLMGNSSPAASGRGFPMSPAKSVRGSLEQTGSTPLGLLLHPPNHRSPSTPSSRPHHHRSGPGAGPPTKALFQGGRPSPLPSSDTQPHLAFAQTLVSPPARRTYLDPLSSRDATVFDSTMLETLSEQGGSVGGGQSCWVTVFGFPASSASFILQQFSAYGSVLERRMAPCGNWVHLRYATPLQAHRALSKNGRLFGGSLMLGVLPYHPQQSEMDDSQKENVFPSSLRAESPFDASVSLLEGPSPTSMRPLTAAYEAARSEHEVVPKSQTPQKSSSVVAKAMEYMFGW